MESLRIALETVLPLFLLLAIGYVVKLSGMMNETSVKQMNKVIFQIFLPLLHSAVHCPGKRQTSRQHHRTQAAGQPLLYSHIHRSFVLL